ncbi:MAG: heme NO-binding domain-containing protein [Alcanivorax sp.]|nr:heme NO-binding domain-containing protein [Alcanivorax sp.]
MHGVILSKLKDYVLDTRGADAWDAIRNDAGMPDSSFVPIRIYPDEDLDALLESAGKLTGLPRVSILEDFGEWVIPPLISMYRAMIPEDWDAVDFLTNVDERVHERVIRMKDPEARPPSIGVTEVAPRELEITYRSHRNMSALAIGCVRGVAAYYGEEMQLLEKGREENGVRCFRVRLTPIKGAATG